MIVYLCNNCEARIPGLPEFTVTPRVGMESHFCSWRCLEELADREAQNGRI